MRIKLMQLMSGILLLPGIDMPAHGQQNLDELIELSPAQLSEIPVAIASGTARPTSQSAAVMSVITAEQIAAMGATDLPQVLETVPGMHMTVQPVTGDYNFTMRGIRNDSNSEVLLLMNGTRFSLPYQGTHVVGMIIPVEDIQRVEVIRGPGSAMYGADAFAGVINIVTKKAGDIDGVNVGGRGGNHNTHSEWAQYGGYWQGWNIASSLQYASNGPDRDSIIKADALTGTPFSLAPGAMQNQTERWNGHLNLQRKHWDLGFWAYSDSNGGLRAGTAGALDDRGHVTTNNYLADVRFSTEDDIKNLELQAHASLLYADVYADIYAAPRGSELPIDKDGNITDPSLAQRNVVFQDGARFIPTFKNTVPTMELTGIYKGLRDHIFRLTSSYRYEEMNVKEWRNFGAGILDTPDSLPVLTNLTGSDYAFITDHHRDIVSIAGQDEWAIAKDWNFTLGLRYDHYSDFGSTWNPRAALVWNASEQLSVKLLYGQAYRAPSFLEQYQRNSALFNGSPNLKPETISTTELAFDYRPSKTLRTALNLYHYEIKDLIGGNFGAAGTKLTETNLPGQDGYGSEFEWDWKFLPDWNLRGNYAWQFARNELNDYRVATVPEHHVYNALAWSFLPKWQLQGQVNWVGHRVSDPGDTRPLPDYETVDITLNSRRLMGHLDLTASVRNLFDAHGTEAATRHYAYNLPIASRMFYFEASVHF